MEWLLPISPAELTEINIRVSLVRSLRYTSKVAPARKGLLWALNLDCLGSGRTCIPQHRILPAKHRQMSLSPDAAETLALQALAWLVANDDLLPVFLDATGASKADLRDQAGDPAFLGSVLDFLMMDDAWVIAFCDAHTIPYERPLFARAALPGGEQVNWT